MVQSRITAWATWTEWQEVYKRLASPNAALRELGVRRVQTWRTRAKLPVAVDLTASLVEVMLNDSEITPSTRAPRSDHELQLLYAMCMVRLVNGIVDAAQRQESVGSILDMSKKLDWPTWFVDLRHDATHRDLPSLPLLRLGAKESLWLLLERFWRPQQEVLERRGRGLASYRGRVEKKPATMLDRRLIDKRLRFLVTAAARKRRRGEDGVGGSSAWGRRPGQDQRAMSCGDPTIQEGKLSLATFAVEDLAGMAVDESRLLRRLFATVLASEPHADGREALALNLLSAASSDNFAIRLMQRIALGALGLTGSALGGTSEERPRLQNICDSASAAQAGAGTAQGCFATVRESLVPEEQADRMLRWLDALLADRDQLGSEGVSAEGQNGDARLRLTMQGLSPWLRRYTLEQVMAAKSTDAAAIAQLLERAVRVWRVLEANAVDCGAGRFLTACGACSSKLMQADMADIAAPAASTIGSLPNVEEGATIGNGPDTFNGTDESVAKLSRSQPSFEDMEALLKERKRRRAMTVLEPWTALGTVFDPKTLQVCSASEPDNRPKLPEGAEALWLAWACNWSEDAPTAKRSSDNRGVVAEDVASFDGYDDDVSKRSKMGTADRKSVV